MRLMVLGNDTTVVIAVCVHISGRSISLFCVSDRPNRRAGITLLGKGGGGFFNKKEIGWFQIVRPQLLSLQNPHERQVDVGSNSYKVCDIF